MQKNIQTVRGITSYNEFYGVTLTHEHILIKLDFIPNYIPHEEAENIEIKLKDLHWIYQHPYSYRPNLLLPETMKDIMVEELDHYLRCCGKNIIDVTTEGLHPNPKYLEAIAQKLPQLNIVAGTGYYVDASQSESVKSQSVETMCHKMHKDITDGFDGTSIKAGIIGEVGCQWPLTNFERHSLQASAHAQTATGCPITIHPGRHPDAPDKILRILQEAGCKMDKLVMGHLDRTIQDVPALLEFAKSGCYCEWDLFGIETSHYQLAPHIDMPSDAQRIRLIKTMLDNGYEDKILLAHDVHTKHRLVTYGGHGFSHINNNVTGMMKVRGISEMQIDKMLKDNPANLLAFK